MEPGWLFNPHVTPVGTRINFFDIGCNRGHVSEQVLGVWKQASCYCLEARHVNVPHPAAACRRHRFEAPATSNFRLRGLRMHVRHREGVRLLIGRRSPPRPKWRRRC